MRKENKNKDKGFEKAVEDLSSTLPEKYVKKLLEKRTYEEREESNNQIS